MKNLSRNLVVASVVVVVIILGIVFSLSQETKTTTIGSVLSLTGKGATYGQSVKNGMDLALDDINLDTEKLKIIYEDTQSEPTRAVNAMQKLIELDHVRVIIGPVLSPEALAMAPLANANNIIMLTPGAGAEDIRFAGDYVFRNRESALPQAETLAEYCYKQGLRKMATFSANTPNAKDYKNAFKKRFEELGGRIISEEEFSEGTPYDYRTMLTKINTPNSEGIYLAGLSVEMAYILKQAKELNIDTKWFASAGIEDPKIFDIAGNSTEGLVYGSSAFDVRLNNSQIQRFVSSYREKYGVDPDFLAANGYDAVKMVFFAYAHGGNDVESIKRELYSIRDWQGMGGVTSFDSDGEVIKPTLIKIIKDGRFEILER